MTVKKGKRSVTMTRDAFHVCLTAAMLIGIYMPSIYVWLAGL